MAEPINTEQSQEAASSRDAVEVLLRHEDSKREWRLMVTPELATLWDKAAQWGSLLNEPFDLTFSTMLHAFSESDDPLSEWFRRSGIPAPQMWEQLAARIKRSPERGAQSA